MATAKSKATNEYTADSMKQLTGLEPIRQSPSQYIGDTLAVSAKNGRNNPDPDEALTAGGFHLFVETLGNASDEATNSGEDGIPYANLIEIILHADQSITVTDNGRGVPPDINKATGKSGLEITYLTMNAGGKFKDRTEKKAGNYKTAQGLHGVGAACVAALSDRLDVTVWRNNKEYRMSAKEGIPGTFADDKIRSKFTKTADGKAVSSKKDDRDAKRKKDFPHGTSVHWHPDPKIWGGTDIPWKDIYDYVNAQSYMAPGCTYRIIDETELGGGSAKAPKTVEFHHPGGINDMIDEKTAKGNNLTPTISLDVATAYEKSVVIENEDGSMGTSELEYNLGVKVALRWTDKSGADIEGYANGVHCSGKHVDGFRRGISRGVGDWLKNSNAYTKADEKKNINANIDDITDGMVAVVEVLLEDQCDFHGQTKDVLGNPEVLSCVSDAVKDEITNWLTSKKNSAAAKRVSKSIVDNARLRAKQKEERESAKKVREFEKSTSWPEKLTNCSDYDSDMCELIIVEGDSAANPCRAMRNSRYQAVFGIKGKIKNTFDLPLNGSGRKKGVLDNEEAAAIYKIYKHYKNIIILADSDPDGAHIEILVYSLFYKHMPEVVEEGRIFAVDAPLYVIETLDDNKTHLAKNDAEKEEIVSKLRKEGHKIKTPISRLKGWGECPPELVESTCLNPETRVLRRLTISDAEKAEETLALAMGNNIEARKEWLTDRLNYGDIELFS